jgi:serine/threonine protein phosphatase 1
VGDIHGRYDLLKALLGKIAEDAAAVAAGRQPVLVFLGDYIDRGPDAAKVLQALVWLQRRGEFGVRPLKGDHERRLIAFLEDPAGGGEWLGLGGDATLAAYGVPPPSADADLAELVRARDALMDSLPASHLQLLDELELMVLAGDYAFVHAGVDPATPLEVQAEADLLQIRQGFVDAPGPFERIIVHGHTWLDAAPRITDHRIALDTGAYTTGVLTAARLDGDALQVLQVRET